MIDLSPIVGFAHLDALNYAVAIGVWLPGFAIAATFVVMARRATIR